MPPIMIPDVNPNALEHSSERDVYVALREQMPEGCWVIHSYPWLRPHRDSVTVTEGEADFVILHPDLGLMVLEVKGGELELERGSWYRVLRNNRDPIQNPFLQARKSMHNIVRYVEERTGWRSAGSYFVYGYAAVFPHCEYRGSLPADADPLVVITANSMSRFLPALEEAWARWTRSPRPMDAATFKSLRDALLPKFHVYQPVGPLIGQTAKQIFEMTAQQQTAFRKLYSSRRVLVEGVAGSGKTFLALDRALTFAASKKRTLLLCYNSELAEWLLHECREDPARQGLLEYLDIRNFHQLALELARSAHVEFQIPSGTGSEEQFWNDEAPSLLEQAVELHDADDQKPPCRYDAIVVDEAQDFCTPWWYPIQESLLTDPDEGPLYVFRDLHQTLRTMPGGEDIPLLLPTRYSMNENCRNTRRIAKSSARIIDIETDVLPRSPEGVKPLVVSARTVENQRGLVLAQVRRLLNEERVLPSSIALIGPRRLANGSLGGLEDIDGIPLVTKASLWRQGHGILVTTSRSFKGLEADAVIVYDVGILSAGFSEADLYVACTRAKCWLVIISHALHTRQLLENAVNKSIAGEVCEH